jgi:hypothetical protein
LTRRSQAERENATVLNETARVCGPVQTGSMTTEEDTKSLGSVLSGDVLVSHRSAVREHEISIVPHAPHATSPSHDTAVSDGGAEAEARGVDAWLTEDQTHVVKLASHRPVDE